MASGLFGRLFGRSSFAPARPDQPLFVIGDIHGRVDLLERLLARAGTDEKIICVGDYVDRGNHSAEVLELLVSRPDILCLKGNHEEIMLSFLSDPELSGAPWLRCGGLQTIASYGIFGLSEGSQGEDLQTARDKMAEKMGLELINWLNNLPLFYQSGNVAIVHAAADPGELIENQLASTLLWGHANFEKYQRTDGMWVVHGHTIVDQPSADRGRVAVDTGAYATGCLTAARITTDSIGFVTA